LQGAVDQGNWDELSQSTLELWQSARTINLYVELDSLAPEMAPWNALRSAVNAGSDSLQTVKNQLKSLSQNELIQPGLRSWILRTVWDLSHYTLLSGKYLRAWEKQTEEGSRFAQTTRPWLQIARYKLFGDLGNKGVPGVDGWRFYRPGIEYATRPWVTDPRSRIVDPNEKAITDDPIQAIVAFRDQLKAWNVELVVMPVPNKETIYPDRLVRGISDSLAGQVGFGRRILDSLRMHKIAVVDLYTAFAEERKRDTSIDDALYLQEDTHWRLRALRLAAHEVRDVLQAQPWFGAKRDSIDYVRKACTVSRDGDVTAMTKLPEARFFQYHLQFSPQIVDCEQVYAVQRDSTGSVVESTLYQDDFRHSRILILGDSFSRIYQTDAPRGAGWIAHLADALREPVASLVSDGGASTLVRQKLARKPGVLRGKTVVVWEFVERDYRFGDEGWKEVAFARAAK
jgi:hypothetical protein